MLREEFIASLAKDGFLEVLTLSRAANQFLEAHAHPFEAKALVIEGQLRLRVNDAEQLYQAGQVFHLPANQSHSEYYGPQGVTYLVGRK